MISTLIKHIFNNAGKWSFIRTHTITVVSLCEIWTGVVEPENKLLSVWTCDKVWPARSSSIQFQTKYLFHQCQMRGKLNQILWTNLSWFNIYLVHTGLCSLRLKVNYSTNYCCRFVNRTLSYRPPKVQPIYNIGWKSSITCPRWKWFTPNIKIYMFRNLVFSLM